jgi:MarR-like DNA-binding transcriptional regulator SgrR of sgrS sRNA
MTTLHSKMIGSARLTFDSMPLTMDTASCADHSGLQLFGLLSAPLAVPDGVVDPAARPVGASEIDSSADGCRHSFRVRPDIGWADGDRLDADDYRCAIVEAARTATATGYWLRGVDRVDAKGDRLTVRLRTPHHRWALLTFLPALCPQRPSGDGAGRYRVSRRGARSIWLEATKNFPEDSRPPRLHIRRLKDPAANTEAFTNGVSDHTSDTAFPFEQLSRYRRSPWLRSGQLGIMAAITFEGGLGDTGAASCRQAIRELLPNEAMAELLPRPLLATSTFMPSRTYQVDLQRALDRQAASPDSSPAGPVPTDRSRTGHDRTPGRRGGQTRPELRLAYDSYYPNRAIAEAIARGLRPGFRVRLVQDRYEQRSKAADLRLNLFRRLHPDLLGIYRGLIFDPPLRSTPSLVEIIRLLVQADRTGPGDGELSDIGQAVHTLVEQSACVLPIAELPGFWLTNLPKSPWEWA